MQLHDGEVALGERAAERRGVLRTVGQRDLESARAGDHVRVRDDVPGRVEHDAGAEPPRAADLTTDGSARATTDAKPAPAGEAGGDAAIGGPAAWP